MIIIQQTTKPAASGSSVDVNIHDSAGAALLNNGAGALQVEQPVSFTSAILAALASLLSAITGGSNSGTLTDTSAAATLTGSLAPLPSAACKYITLINLSTNTSNINYTINGGTTNNLEPGYSLRANVSNANLIEVSQSAGEQLEYTITA